MFLLLLLILFSIILVCLELQLCTRDIVADRVVDSHKMTYGMNLKLAKTLTMSELKKAIFSMGN